ncbi:hypothetical protein BSFA1_43990 [Burkholderia sp. SFA1]|nr:hypothetical protein BSFA1_43990 [Burkholderia sp. SFA1]
MGFKLLLQPSELSFAGSRFGVGLLALPLPGAGVTFFAAAKKVTKESSFSPPAVTRTLAIFLLGEWPSPKECSHKPNRAWIAHGLTSHNFERAGAARNSFGTALRAAVGYAGETHAYPVDPSAAKRAGA